MSKVKHQINDLYEDFRDGVNLIKLLEILSGEQLPAPLDGNLRIHSIGNVNIALQYLKQHSIRLENIDPIDIVDGNGRLTLGLLWMIILRFEVSRVNSIFFLHNPSDHFSILQMNNIKSKDSSNGIKPNVDSFTQWYQNNTDEQHQQNHIHHNFSYKYRLQLVKYSHLIYFSIYLILSFVFVYLFR